MWKTDRPNTTARGYGNTHQQLRRQWQHAIDQHGVPCARGCGHLITTGDRWHLDHNDTRTAYLGPSCEHCNLQAAGRAGRAARPTLRRDKGQPLGRISPNE